MRAQVFCADTRYEVGIYLEIFGKYKISLYYKLSYIWYLYIFNFDERDI